MKPKMCNQTPRHFWTKVEHWITQHQHPQSQNVQHPHPQDSQHLKPQNLQCPQLQQQPQSFQLPKPQDSQQSFGIPDRYAEQIKLRREWEGKNWMIKWKALFYITIQAQSLTQILNQIIDMSKSMKHSSKNNYKTELFEICCKWLRGYSAYITIILLMIILQLKI